MIEKTRVQLDMSERQADIVMRALDMFYRVGMGQLSGVIEHLVPEHVGTEEWCKRRDACEEAARLVRAAAMPELPRGSYYGIGSPEIDEDNRVACDIYRQIRSGLAWHRNPAGGMFVSFDPVYAHSHEELPLINVETTREPSVPRQFRGGET